MLVLRFVYKGAMTVAGEILFSSLLVVAAMYTGSYYLTNKQDNQLNVDLIVSISSLFTLH